MVKRAAVFPKCRKRAGLQRREWFGPLGGALFWDRSSRRRGGHLLKKILTRIWPPGLSLTPSSIFFCRKNWVSKIRFRCQRERLLAKDAAVPPLRIMCIPLISRTSVCFGKALNEAEDPLIEGALFLGQKRRGKGRGHHFSQF